MQIVIEIPESVYEHLKQTTEDSHDEDIAIDVEDTDFFSPVLQDLHTAADIAGIHVLRSDQPVSMINEGINVVLGEGMIAQRHTVSSHFQKAVVDLLSNTLAVSSILAIDYQQVILILFSQKRKMLVKSIPS